MILLPFLASCVCPAFVLRFAVFFYGRFLFFFMLRSVQFVFTVTVTNFCFSKENFKGTQHARVEISLVLLVYEA